MADHPVPASCPKCGGPRVAEILYGRPDPTPELMKDLETGRIVLGGCFLSNHSPSWSCRDCGHSW